MGNLLSTYPQNKNIYKTSDNVNKKRQFIHNKKYIKSKFIYDIKDLKSYDLF